MNLLHSVVIPQSVGGYIRCTVLTYVSPPSSKVYLLPTIHPGVRPRHLTLCCVSSNIFLLLKTTFIFSGVSPALSLKKIMPETPFRRCMIRSQIWTKSVPDAKLNYPGILNAGVVFALASAVVFSMQSQ